MQNSTVVAVDVAKTIFEVAVSDRPGHVCRRDRPTRAQFLAFFIAYPGATVVMEACGSAPYWGRELQKRGHRAEHGAACPRPSFTKDAPRGARSGRGSAPAPRLTP
jgi:hypothetical protein